MVRTVVRLHTVILFVASLALLIAPGSIMTAFGVADPTFPVLALARMIAGLLVVLAAAILPVPALPVPVRGYALALIAGAYGILAMLTLTQQVAIWSSVAGGLLTTQFVLHAVAFGWLANAERRSVPAGV